MCRLCTRGPQVGVMMGLGWTQDNLRENDSSTHLPALLRDGGPLTLTCLGCFCLVSEVHTSRPQVWSAHTDVGSSKVPIEGDPQAILRNICMV